MTDRRESPQPTDRRLPVTERADLFAAAPVAATRSNWVPIRSLAPRHRERIQSHLLALDERDRYLRFGYPATDEQIVRYVQALDFERDEVFGIFNRHLTLIAMSHLAYAPISHPAESAMAEFGVSVSKQARGRRYGARLFEHAVLRARNRGCDRLFIHALSENTAMLKIARNAGAQVVRDGTESEAWLQLPPDNLASQMGEFVAQSAGELNYRLKVQARRMDDWLGLVGEVKAHLRKLRRQTID